MSTTTSRRRAAACRFLALLLIPFALGAAGARAVDIELPELGDSSSGYVSPVIEQKLGDAWLRMFRSQAPTVSDPLLQDYFERVIFDLASHSELKQANLKVVLVQNETINAFAVPGGVVGAHNGLLLYTQHEDELASVFAHELAHLSQRHFARGVEDQRRHAVPNLLMLLGSMVVAATSGGDAGMAAITASQAAIQQHQLSFSRTHEREADRVGMATLVNAGYSPEGMPRMFSRMLDTLRYNTQRPPEFLLSHPVTESRVADSQNRARNYTAQGRSDSLDFDLMRARVRLSFDTTPEYAAKRFRAEIEKDGGVNVGNHYGLALALIKANNLPAARAELAPLLRNHPDNIVFQMAAADIDVAAGHSDLAATRLARQLELNPDNHALTMGYADALLRMGKPVEAQKLLVAHSRTHPDEPQLWYTLAETHGLAGNVLDVHRARAEYFILNGALDQAEKQLGYALALADRDFTTTASIQARIADIRTMRKEMDEL